MNPGPTAANIFPCGYCDKPVTWENEAVCCDGDNCNIWHHKSCIELCSQDHDLLHRSNVQWHCVKCDSLNVDSFSFHSYYLDITHNFYAPLQDSECTLESLSSPGASSGRRKFSPNKASTPKDKRPRTRSSTSSLSSVQSSQHNLTNHHTKSSTTSHSHSSECNNTSNGTFPKKQDKQNLRILSLNCRGIRGKTSEFSSIIDYTKPDIVCGVESFLHGVKPGQNPEGSAIRSSEVFPENYNVYRNDRNGDGGGVFILIHKSLIAMEMPEFTSDGEINWAKITLQGCKDLYVGVYYMPQRNLQDLQYLEKSLDALNDKRNRHIILCGDFNCPSINWKESKVDLEAADRIVQEKLVDVAIDHSLTQVQEEPTRYNNLLDLTFTNNPSLIRSCSCIPGISDHEAVVVDSIIRPSYTPTKKRKMFCYKKANWDGLNADCAVLSQQIKTKYDSGECVINLWNMFKTGLNKAIEKHIPSKMIFNKHHLPWMNKDLKKMIKKKAKLHRKAKVSKEWTKFIEYQKICKQAFRRAQWDYVNNTIDEGLANNNSKPFWRYIKSQKNDNVGVAPLKSQGKLHSEGKDKAEILINQFSSVFTKHSPTDDQIPDIPDKDRVKESLKNIKIDTKGVEILLKKIQSHKAQGPDNIPNQVLSTCAENLAPVVSTIFQKSLDSGKLPKDWTDANIAPVYKKGDKHAAENYRPVSLTSVLSKTLEHIVCHHLHKHFGKNNVLTSLNHGFRSGYSCETQLTVTVDELARNIDNGLQTDVAILDFSKAFDTVPHKRLLQKLEAYGVRGQLHTWIESFLCKRQMRVIVDGEASTEHYVESGVPQGTVLGPLLFLVHINDLPDSVKSSVRLFADDCLLYRPIRSRADHITLQDDLLQLENWAKINGMSFNAKKCYILSVNTKPQSSSSFFYQLNNTILKNVDNNPYLGLLISKDLKWTTHIDKISNKASSTLGFITRNTRKCPMNCRKTAYIALVRSTLEYGSTVWDPYLQKDIARLEKIQKKAARFIKQDYHSRDPGSMTAMLQELGLPSLESRRKENRLCQLYKISNGLIPAIPPGDHLTPMRNKRKITAKSFKDCEASNFVTRHQNLNDNCLKVPSTNTVTYRNSFFPRTISDWNQLKNTSFPSVEAFRTAIQCQ